MSDGELLRTTAFVAQASPLSATGESWLQLLVDVTRNAKVNSSPDDSNSHTATALEPVPLEETEHSSSGQDTRAAEQAPEDRSDQRHSEEQQDPHVEPTPQNCSSLTPDPLVAQWHSRTSEARSRSQHASSDDGMGLTLAERSIIARRSVEETKQQHLFWTNRLRLLKAEALKIESKAQPKNRGSSEGSATNVSSFATQTTTAQLEEGRRREAGIRKERAAAIQLQRVTHSKTLREAQHAMLENRREKSRQTKIHAENHASIVEALKAEDLEERCRRRDKIHHEKVAMMLKRVRNAAMRAEEAKLLYEEKIHQKQEDDEAHQLEIIAIVQESSKLVQKIRQLRRNGQNGSSQSD